MTVRFFKAAALFCLMVVLVFFCEDAFAQNSAEQYASVVAQLRKDGYRGIDAALAQFEDIIGRDPGYTEAYVGAADALLVKYEFTKSKNRQWMQRALDYLDTAIDRNPETAQYYFKRALVNLNLEKPSRAEADLKKAVALKHDYLKAQVLYLQYLLSAGRGTKARSLADEWIRGYGADPAPRKYFGDLFFQARAYRDALDYYSQVIQRVEKAPNTHAAMGKAYWELGERKKAIAAFKKALIQDPKLIQVHFVLGTCLGESRDLKGAINHFGRYLQKFPDDVAALNNLALLYERNGQSAEARLTWMKLKSKTREKVYLQRAETHLYRLAYESVDSQEKQTSDAGPQQTVKGVKSHE